jgi:hypothetical protein
MKLKNVPQDAGMAGDLSEVCYAVDDQGNYVLAPSLGWQAKNIANSQAWQIVEEKAARAAERVRAGKASPLAYHMCKHQMSVRLLAKYAGLFRWQVRRHLRPEGFRRMPLHHRRRYAELFEVSIDGLEYVPESVMLNPHHDSRDD